MGYIKVYEDKIKVLYEKLGSNKYNEEELEIIRKDLSETFRILNDELNENNFEEKELKDLSDKLKKLSGKEKEARERQLRNIYLRRIQTGVIEGPTTGKISVDKPFLKYFDEKSLIVDYPRETIYEYIMKPNRGHENEVALRYMGTKITFGEMDRRIDETVRSFKKLGVQKCDTVAICMPNTPEAAITVFALNKMGAIASMIHPLSAENQIKNYLNEEDLENGIKRAKVIVALDSPKEDVLGKLRNIINKTSLEHVVSVTPAVSMPKLLKIGYELKTEKFRTHDKRFINYNSFIKLSKKDKSEVKTNPYKENDPAIIMHTGGSEGEPKGAIQTNDNYVAMIEQFFKSEDNFERGDKVLTVMPVFHGFGLCSSLILELHVGVSCILVPKVEKEKGLTHPCSLDKLIIGEKPNHIIGVPTLFRGIINNEEIQKADLSFLKYVVSGGDLVKDSLESQINEFLKQRGSNAVLCKGYGLTEMVAGATFACNEYNGPYTIGIPMVDTNIKLVKPGTNIEVKENEPGVMCFEGPSVMSGYLNNKKVNDEALQDGWLHTGDIAVWTDGLLYFKQRKGDMIISSGINVYPSQIEGVLEEHPAVASCAVIGVDHPYKEQVPKAFIVLKEGCEPSGELDRELKRLCEKNLDKYSQPASIEYVQNLPETLLGKISRKELRKKNK